MNHTCKPMLGLLLLAGATLLSCGRGGGGEQAEVKNGAPDATEPVAYLDGQPITMAELEQSAASDLATVDQQRYDILVGKLDQMASERLVQKEATAKNTTPEELVRTEVTARLTPITEEQVQSFWNQVKAQVGDQTLEQLRPKIEQELNNRQWQVRVGQYLTELKSKSDFKVVLDAPRHDVVVPAGEPSMGREDAPVTVVEFSDFDCPYCRSSHPAVQRLLAEYGDQIRFVYRDFPLAMHKRAVPAAQAARCAGEQNKYWEYYKDLMEGQGQLSDEDLKQRAAKAGLDVNSFTTCFESNRFQEHVQNAFKDGQRLGVSGTPTFFINGRMLVGAQPYEKLKEIVDQELARASSGAGGDKNSSS